MLLPVTTFLENTDLYFAYGHHYLQMARTVLPPPGETKSNVEIFRLLAERMGFDDPCFRESEDDMIRTLLASDHPFLKGITLERLEREHFVRLNIAREGEPFLPFAEGGFGTPSGRCSLAATGLDYIPPEESRLGNAALRSRFPLELLSSKNDDSMNSTFGHRAGVDRQTSVLYMNRRDAKSRGIASGDSVRTFNDRGSCLLVAEVDGVVEPGVVRAPSVRWGKKSATGSGINALTSDKLTDIGGGPVFYSCLVEVEKCGD
jgi:anaerobic selenocysteine-containing dehydrogenase